MKTLRTSSRYPLLILAGLAWAGCAGPAAPKPAAADAPAPTLSASAGQETFATSADATKALLTAAEAKDQDALNKIFGPAVSELLSGDPTQDAIELDNFSVIAAQMCNPVTVSEHRIVLYLGAKNWPFPIPLVQNDGKWFFDTAAGQQEILNRRIGLDELTAIGVCQVYLLAQHEYAAEDRDGSGVLKYAQRLNSNPGKKDGLYWEPVDGEPPSPFGPLVAQARDEGYPGEKPVGRGEPFHGYFFKILQEQGPAAPGGKYNYVINGNMIAGFALIAYPAHWGESGIMTFIVNQQGKVYQHNFGENSAALAAAVTVFNPDQTWTAVPDHGLPAP